MTIDSSERRNAAARRSAPAAYRRDDPVPYRRVGTLSSSKRDPATSETTYLIKAAGADVLQFGEKEYFLWRLLDGTNSVADIQAQFRRRFGGPLTPEQFESFVEQLVECGAVEAQRAAEPALPKPVSTAAMPKSLDEAEPELPAAQTRRPIALAAFDPSAVLQALDWICGPLRFFRWMLFPALLGILICLVLNAAAIAAELAQLNPAEAAGIGVLALLLAGIVPPLSQAVTASFLGYQTRACRIALRGWVVPRLVFNDSAWGEMESRHVLTVVAAPCLARLVLFEVGVGIWLGAHESGGLLPAFGIAIGVLGLLSFLLSAAPFLPGQGRQWLATVFAQPNPWTAGFGQRLHALILSAFWLQAVVGVVLVIAAATAQWLHPVWFEPSMAQTVQSLALPLLVATPIMTRLWINVLRTTHGTPQPSYPVQAYAGGGTQALDPAGFLPDGGTSRSRMLVDAGAPPRRRQTAERWPSTKPLIFWAGLLAFCLAVGFIPYPYEAGGNFALLPFDKVLVNARVSGELTEVLVSEGDWVEPGQLMGMLSDWDARHALDTARAQLDSAKAALQVLFETPRPEDVELARKQYEAALAKLPYDRAQYERYAKLVTTDAVSRANYEQVLSTFQQDQAAADVARANYDQVRAGPEPSQIEQARALVRQNTATVAYDEDQLERTRIRATSPGKVVTPNPQLLRGMWFNPTVQNGATVFTVEDQHVVQADIYVPETDVGHVRVGGVVRAKPWGYAKETFTGTVISIASDAMTDPAGSTTPVVRVRARIPNPDGKLRPTMDGYAKMTGVYLPTWEAYTQMIIRLVLVQIWSWIP